MKKELKHLLEELGVGSHHNLEGESRTRFTDEAARVRGEDRGRCASQGPGWSGQWELFFSVATHCPPPLELHTVFALVIDTCLRSDPNPSLTRS